ncbi:MAG: sugar transferase [Candidatus Sulfotelmatobacter sp.]
MGSVGTSAFDGSGVVFSPYWKSDVRRAVKRGLDVLVAGALLILFSPLFMFLAIAVKSGSRGKIFYRWRVVGKEGRPFLSFKFRSMVSNADELRDHLEGCNEMTGPVFKITDDPRVTSTGKWMRRYSLDELPQLYSVLKGDMSLVGPRPPLATEFSRFTAYQRQKLSVKPGITGLWQVSGRNQISDFDQWVRLDLDYIRRWSLWLDTKILLRTLAAVFAGSGK